MIERPQINEEKVLIALNQNYSIQASHLEFLPVGNDASAFSYRVHTNDGTLYFLKLKTKLANLAALSVPRFLNDHGVEQVVAPCFTKTQKLFREIDGFALILYPFIAGNQAMTVGMSDAQWMELGSVLKRIHQIELPSEIARVVNRETFIPKWGNLARDLHKHINKGNFADPFRKELAIFWREKNETIQTLIERTEKIGKQLQQMDLEFLLCHADIHTANILITDEQNMFIVDWDDTLLAPKERDLMFVLEKDSIRTREEQLFFREYGNMEINQLALAYYRYEWCVQEIGDYGQRVFLAKDGGEDTKQDAVEGFTELFSPNDVIETAFHTSLESERRDNP